MNDHTETTYEPEFAGDYGPTDDFDFDYDTAELVSDLSGEDY